MHKMQNNYFRKSEGKKGHIWSTLLESVSLVSQHPALMLAKQMCWADKPRLRAYCPLTMVISDNLLNDDQRGEYFGSLLQYNQQGLSRSPPHHTGTLRSRLHVISSIIPSWFVKAKLTKNKLVCGCQWRPVNLCVASPTPKVLVLSKRE